MEAYIRLYIKLDNKSKIEKLEKELGSLKGLVSYIKYQYYDEQRYIIVNTTGKKIEIELLGDKYEVEPYEKFIKNKIAREIWEFGKEINDDILLGVAFLLNEKYSKVLPMRVKKIEISNGIGDGISSECHQDFLVFSLDGKMEGDLTLVEEGINWPYKWETYINDSDRELLVIVFGTSPDRVPYIEGIYLVEPYWQ